MLFGKRRHLHRIIGNEGRLDEVGLALLTEKLIDELKDDPVNKLLFVNRKQANTREYKYEDYWEFGEYVNA